MDELVSCGGTTGDFDEERKWGVAVWGVWSGVVARERFCGRGEVHLVLTGDTRLSELGKPVRGLQELGVPVSLMGEQPLKVLALPGGLLLRRVGGKEEERVGGGGEGEAAE